jgi:preprotein translocase subunit SecG
MTLAAVSTALSISITLLIIVLVVVSILMILVVMMQRPKQEGLGAAFGGGMTDQLLGAGTTSFLQKATVVLGILFFVLSLILGILVGRSNKARGLDIKAPVATEEAAAPAPGIADDIKIEDGEEDAILEDVEAALSTGTETDSAGKEAVTEEVEPAPEETATPAEDASPEETPEEDAAAEETTESETSEEENAGQ